MEQYDLAVEDFGRYATQVEQDSEKIPPSISEFAWGAAKGVPEGILASGKGIWLFLGDLITHPIHTSIQMYEAISTLVVLARENQWERLGEALSPEIHQLITQWDALPSEKRGELAGYAFGKHGSDFFTPGAAAKLAKTSANGAKGIAAVLQKLKTADRTIALETAAGVGNPARIAEVVRTARLTTTLAENLEFTADKIRQLKQAGTLEQTVFTEYVQLSGPMKESYDLFKNAQNTLKPYAKKPMPEYQVRELIHATGVPVNPRPKGIPDNFRVAISEKGAGQIYTDPTGDICIRSMPGKPHSINQWQRARYIVYTKNRKCLDKFGNEVPKGSLEAHIPFDEFTYMD